MRKFIIGVAAIAAGAAWSAPALAKAHLMPSDRAQQLGQANADATLPTGARNADAKGLIPGTDGGAKGVDGQVFSDIRSAAGGTVRGLNKGFEMPATTTMTKSPR